MWLGVITLFPDMFDSVCREGIFSRAIESGVVSMRFFNPRDYTSDRHRTVDDRPYGGGAGMVMKVQPLQAAVEAAKQQAPQNTPVVLMSPQGKKFSQTDGFCLHGTMNVAHRLRSLGISKKISLHGVHFKVKRDVFTIANNIHNKSLKKGSLKA